MTPRPACSGDRYDRPACGRAWIRMLARDRTGIILLCLRCGCRFGVDVKA
jgi:hypothetical protein